MGVAALGIYIPGIAMAEKGMVGEAEVSISQRLSRKREAFYRERESEEPCSSSIKKRRDNLPSQKEQNPVSVTKIDPPLSLYQILLLKSSLHKLHV